VNACAAIVGGDGREASLPALKNPRCRSRPIRRSGPKQQGQGSLTAAGASNNLILMDQPADSPSFSIRRQVGRPSTPRQVLWQLEEMRKFFEKHAHGKPIIVEGDVFPVRKIVGRPRSGQG
jgi:hypothetical protein